MTALDDVYFNFGEQVMTGCHHDDCLFYMPGFWYRRNLRSPQEAPSFIPRIAGWFVKTV